MAPDPQAVANIAVKAAEDKKAYDVTVLDISSVSIIADYFIICSGHSTSQVKAVAEHIQEKLEENGINALRREGFREGKWVLLDYADVVIHVFLESERKFYNLERLWGDARVVDMPVNSSISAL
ncbi:MAG: ribosome silencing factor [Peptococcaceae bacterium]|nr:ribosome silencing factor [Peptococcaceae bacterium]